MPSNKQENEQINTVVNNNDKQKKNRRGVGRKTFYQRFPILVNIFLMLLLSLVIVMLVVYTLDRYTKHGESVEVPNVIGLSLEKGAEQLEKVHLKYEVVDSVYNEEGLPGAIRDIVPVAGSKVKSERLVFLTINATSKPQLALPEVKDMSMRQAKATLVGIGFTTIMVKHVPGEYDNLTQCVEDKNGTLLTPGTRIDYDTPVTLVVSSNSIDFPTDSLFSIDLNQDFSTPADTTKEKAPENLTEEEKWW